MEDRKDLLPRDTGQVMYPWPLDRLDTGAGAPQIHVHHHYAAPVIDTRPVDQNPGQDVLDRYVPYFIVLLGGLIIMSGLVVVLVMVTPVLVAILGSVVAVVIAAAAALGAVAVLMGGMAVLSRSARQDPKKDKRNRRR